MDFEKRSSKRSFLQLFDWNAKSRKKLFSNMSESSVKPNQSKENSNDSTFSLLQQVHRNACDPGPSIIENYNMKFSSSPSEDIAYGTKAPGVVARLMGLDSLPTSDVIEPSFTPVLGSRSFRDSHYSTGFPGFQSEEHVIMHDGMRNKLDGFAKNPVEVILHKVQSRPIGRFQTEALPPKSAKPISITHHRLLSPIKSPGFIQTMDTDYLLEAPAKIIQQSPRLMETHKLPSLGSSSVPLRIQDVRQKAEVAEKSRSFLETSQKGKEQRFTQYLNRRSHEIAQGRAVEGLESLRASGRPKNTNSEDSRKTRSTSFSVQGKPNIPKRDGLSSVDNCSSFNHRQPDEFKRNFLGRNLETKHKNVEMETRIGKQPVVLRQNNQKQNSESNEERDSLRRHLLHEKERKSSSSGFSRPKRTVNKIVVSNDSLLKGTGLLKSDSRKEQAYSTVKTSSRKKEVTNRNHVSDEGIVARLRQDERSTHCNYEIQKSNIWDSADGKNGMDVISFMFSSPIKNCSPESTISKKSPENKRSSSVIHESCNNQSIMGLDAASGDALNILLEQKLQELASRVESSKQDCSYPELLCGSADSSQGIIDMISSKSSECNSQLDPSGDKAGVSFRFDCSFSSPLSEPQRDLMPKWQASNVVHNGTVPCYSVGSCKFLDTSRCISSKGSKRCLSVEALEIIERSCSRNSQGVDMELPDSASSTSFDTSISDITSTFTSSITRESSNWELDYIRFLLSNASLMFEEFAVGQMQKLIAPDLFNMLEDGKLWRNQNVEEDLKFSRKALFDCVGESLESRCMPLINKGGKHWMKLTVLFERPDWLSEELYREISGWRSMEDMIVDELVDKDMSTPLGRWVEFETEAYDEGVEIEKVILTTLFDELIAEF